MAQRNNYQPDILSYLAEVVKQNTRAYAADFDYDAKRLWDSAQETDMKRRSFLWMSRLHGTWCVSEREVFLDDTNANCIWTHYADCPEGILAYRIVVEGIRDGKLAGKIIPLDYAKQVQRVIKSALPIVKIQYRDKDDSFCENSYHPFMNSSMPYCILCHAIDVAIEHQPNMPKMQVICNEVRIRTGKRTNEAISRALNRAAKDIWQNGRRRELRAYWIEDPPTAKELISLISAKLWADRQT